MKINRKKLLLAIANSCMTARDIQKAGGLSSATVAKAKNDPNYTPELITIGKLARALGVNAIDLLEEEA